MRTTIELTDEQRSRLLEAAASRGEKGFSSIIQEALEHYFAASVSHRERVDKALAVLGSLSGPDAERLEKDVRSLRRSWR